MTNSPTPMPHAACALADDALPDARLDEARCTIDAIDAQLVVLLNERAACSLRVRRIKAQTGAPVFCPERERQLLDALQARNPGPLPDDHLLDIYKAILASSKRLQSMG